MDIADLGVDAGIGGLGAVLGGPFGAALALGLAGLAKNEFVDQPAAQAVQNQKIAAANNDKTIQAAKARTAVFTGQHPSEVANAPAYVQPSPADSMMNYGLTGVGLYQNAMDYGLKKGLMEKILGMSSSSTGGAGGPWTLGNAASPGPWSLGVNTNLMGG